MKFQVATGPARVGRVLEMKHSYVGKVSSANHKDKYKVDSQQDAVR
jgi:hypothetical protein